MFAIGTGLLFFAETMRICKGPRNTGLICGAIMVFCVFISSWIVNFGGFVVVYGIIFGFFSGILYIMTIFIAYRFFPKNKGLVAGIVLTGYGFGTFIFS